MAQLSWLFTGCLVIALWGCDTFMTQAPSDSDVLDAPLGGLPKDLNLAFLQGDENFEKAFTVAEGLGPIFNNVACGACHPGDGRGTPDLGFNRFSQADDLIRDRGGPQHQDRGIPGIPAEEIPPGVDLSFRLPPPVFGVGLIEAIPEATILANADPNDDDGDGISGRPNFVNPPDFVPPGHVGAGPGPQLGRFSRKAQVTSLLEQVAAAYQQDMGITNDFIPDENLDADRVATLASGDQVPDPELQAATVLQTVMYVRLLSPPGRGKTTAQVERGEAVFANLSCTGCHIPSMQTGANPIAALDNVQVNLYSDLLLHDMGPGLADNRPDGDATGTEWRTAPLWGTRLVGEFLDGQEFYLHDGRARTLDEAIVAHGGEAEAAKQAYIALEEADQQALIAFLKSL